LVAYSLEAWVGDDSRHDHHNMKDSMSLTELRKEESSGEEIT
jgi:hypothetical protein